MKGVSAEMMNKNTALKSKKNYANSKKRNDYMWGWLLIAPTTIGLLILNIYPAIQSLLMSFQNVNSFGFSTWIGLENYVRLIQDSEFWQACWNTFKYALLQVPITVVLSTVIAVFLNKKIKGVGIYRTIFFLPMVAAPAAIAMVWRWLYNSEYGLINHLLSLVGYQGNIEWITDPNVAIYSIIIVGIWSNVGYNMILLLAGLQEVPNEYYEAATVDGAGPFRQFFQITLPLISPSLFFVMVTSVISSLQVFDVIFMMIDKTNSALETSQSLVYLFYDHSFVLNDKGYGSAIIMVLVLIIMVITIVQLYLQKKWVHYD